MFLTKAKALRDAHALGKWGEKRCLKFLQKKKYRKVCANFASRNGEIDLIMMAPDRTIVFVEIKTRKSETFATAESAITNIKKSRLIKTAKYFLSQYKLENHPLRFDAVTIILNPDKTEEIRHYENIFTP